MKALLYNMSTKQKKICFSESIFKIQNMWNKKSRKKTPPLIDQKIGQKGGGVFQVNTSD